MINGIGGVGAQATPDNKTTLLCMRSKHINITRHVISYV